MASANPTFYADLANPQSLNKYVYCYNNPLLYVDPTGHSVVKELLVDSAENFLRGVLGSVTYGAVPELRPNSNDSFVSLWAQEKGCLAVAAAGLLTTASGVSSAVGGGILGAVGGTVVEPGGGTVAGGAALATPGMIVAGVGVAATGGAVVNLKAVSNAKSQGEYDRHVGFKNQVQDRIAKLQDQLAKAKGAKRTEPIKEDIKKAKEELKGYEKEMRQKWPNGRPE